VIVKELKLYQFKNHENISLSFGDKINAITGSNGIGKTNILDAIFYLGNTKSYFNPSDKQIISLGCSETSIFGKVTKDQEYELLGVFGENRKKTFKKNGKPYTRLVDHIGFLPSVFITPYDISLVFEGSEERRRFMDFTISQINKEYLTELIRYRKVLDQRNAYLKSCEGRSVDPILLEGFDEKLAYSGHEIHRVRTSFIADFLPHFQRIHKELAEEDTSVSFEYFSYISDMKFQDLLRKNRALDIAAQRTSSGTHKDDLIFEMAGMPLKKFGSQGQIKSYVVALKLAQYEFLSKQTGDKPLLLLDDIFEKIDEKRSKRLMELVCSDRFGQIFISDTHHERVKEHFDPFGVDFKQIKIGSESLTE